MFRTVKLPAPLFFVAAIWLCGLLAANFIPAKAALILFFCTSPFFFYKTLRDVVLVLMIFSAGVIYAHQPFAADRIDNLVKNPVRTKIFARVTSIPRRSEYGWFFSARLLKAGNFPVGGGIRLFSYTPLQLGDYFTAPAELEPLPEPLNPGQADFRTYNQLNGIYAQGRLLGEAHAGGNYLSRLERITYNCRKIISDKFAKLQNGALAKAIFLGDKTEIKEAYYTYKQAGLVHLLAISGMHVGFLAFALFAFLSLLPLPKNLIKLFSIALLVSYGQLCLWPIPVTRAIIMSACFLFASSRQRLVNPNQVLSISFLVITLCEPLQIYQPGFQLSFFITFCLINFLPYFPYPLRKKHWTKPFCVNIWQLFIGSVVAITVSLPITLYHYHSLNFNGLFANLLCLPLFSLVMPLTALLALLPSGPVFTVYASAYAWLTDAFQYLVNRAAAFPFYYNVADFNSTRAFFFIFILLLFWLGLKYRKRSALWLPIFLLLLFVPPATKKEMQLVAFSLPKGEAFFLKSEKATILIDTGEDKEGENIVLPALAYYGINQLDYLVISHPHSDHIGGLDEIVRGIRIKHAVLTPVTNNFCKFGATTKVHIVSDSLSLANGMLKFWSPPKWDENLNNTSLIAKISYQGRTILFTGDAEIPEAEWLITKKEIKSDILKIPHHGSATSLSLPLLEKIAPQYAIISAPLNRKKQFPGKQWLAALEEKGIKTYITNKDKALLFTLTEKGLSITPDNRNAK